MKTVKYPEMREEFLAELRLTFFNDSSDKARSQRAFDYLINFIYDDTALGSNAESLLGWMLFSSKEVRLVKEFVSSLDSLLNDFGVNLELSQVEETESWSTLRSQASSLLAEMK